MFNVPCEKGLLKSGPSSIFVETSLALLSSSSTVAAISVHRNLQEVEEGREPTDDCCV